MWLRRAILASCFAFLAQHTPFRVVPLRNGSQQCGSNNGDTSALLGRFSGWTLRPYLCEGLAHLLGFAEGEV